MWGTLYRMELCLSLSPLKEVNVKWSGWGRGENVTSTIVAVRNGAKNGKRGFETEMARGRGTE